MTGKIMNFICCLCSFALAFSCTQPAVAETVDPGEKQPSEEEKPPVQKADTVRILAIGNSFSEDVVEQNLYELFKAAGIEAVIGNMYIGGCSLSKHWSNAESGEAAYSYRKIVSGRRSVYSSTSLQQALVNEKWDYISFQQGAGLYSDYDSCFPYLPNLIAYARKWSANKKFKVIYHATWAAAQNSTKNYFINYFHSSQGYMYTSSNEMLGRLLKTDGLQIDLVCNSIDAIQNVRTSYLGDTMNRDGWHLSYTHGRFTAACLWFERISGKNVLQNSFNLSSISDEDNRICKYAAHYAALFPTRIVDLSDTTRLNEQNPPFADPPADPAPHVVPGADSDTLALWIFDKTLAVKDGFKATWTTSETELGKYAYSNAPGEVGYFIANGGGQGKLSYVQVDKTQWTEDNQRSGRYLLNGTPGGQPAICGHMRGDYWLFESTGERSLPAGTKLSLKFTMHPGNYGAKYWRVEYLDGTEWVPASATTTISIHDEDVVYNLDLATNAKTDYICNATLTNAMTSFKVRVTCCSSQQVNGKWFAYPNTPAVTRIAGMVSSGDLPLMKIVR